MVSRPPNANSDDRGGAPSQISLSEGEARYRAYRQARQDARLSTRRRVLRWVIRAGVGAFSLALLLPALALRALTRDQQTVAAGDLLVYAVGDSAGLPVAAESIEPGTAVQAFPEGKSDNERNLIELVRLTETEQADLVAYSAICTHLGCTVLGRLSDQGYIVCPCHASVFNPARAAEVISGPANRPLPGLPIQASAEGNVVSAGGFDGPVGPI